VLVFCLVLAGVIINVCLGLLWNGPAPDAYLIYPPFAFYRGLSIMNQASADVSVPSYKMSMMKPGDEVFKCVIALIVETIIVFIAAAYLIAVIPSEYGTHRPWHFPITDTIKWIKRYREKGSKEQPKEDSVKITIDEETDADDHFGEDDDVQAERQRVFNKEYPADSSVIIKDMRKVYPNGKLALRSATLAIDVNL